MSDDPAGWPEAWAEALRGAAEGGVPIGAALVRRSDGHVLARGRNLRYQTGDVTAHAEVVTLRNAGLVTLRELAGTTIVSTAVPCLMCAGAVAHVGIRSVVAGLADAGGGQTPGHRFLLERGIEVVDLRRFETIEPMLAFIRAHPDDWMEDFGTALEGVDLSALAPRK